MPVIEVNEESSSARFVAAARTSVAAFLVDSEGGHLSALTRVLTWAEFERQFTYAAAADRSEQAEISTTAWSAVYGWFSNGGGEIYIVPVSADDTAVNGTAQDDPRGLAALESVEVQIVVAPDLWNTPATAPARAAAIASHCARQGDRIAVLHLEKDAAPVVDAVKALGIGSEDLKFATVYHPWLNVQDPSDSSREIAVPPTGHVAGVWARVDSERGVHKAPANEGLRGVLSLTLDVSDAEQGEWNDVGVNGLRTFRNSGIRVWGARTLAASDASDVEHIYLNVRRTINFIKESIRQSTQWVVFEKNDDALRTSVQTTVSNFLTSLWRRGALVGATPDQAFFVRCDESNNSPEDVAEGKLTVDVGVAIVRPAEFVTFQVTQTIDQS
ncbi:phage tail sheath subtilisin-like domain-containing protein [Streptomyces sp. CS090A]|uniref:phage tail sheath family protein n=1 Tax=Streptomyces sp. CS090A TaxID=2162710 RepID=UPI0013A5B654|nr:phage tail sheath subtilisin-like domain-containing protein [Streptomyces sp. CS090A]